ncbi:hypothetical protein D3C87_347850 [compost metagenome]
MSITIRSKERESILQSLRIGVTPRLGLQHIQVGRANEVDALCRDVANVADGGASFRMVIGEYGSGKTFFLSVVRAVALEKKLVTVHADLSPDRRIHSTSGQARSLYSELMKNISTRAKPDGNAMVSVVERFISQARQVADERGVDTSQVIRDKLSSLSEMVGGYDFARVIEQYWHGYVHDNAPLKDAAIRWLRAEYATKTEANSDLGVRSIISDEGFYDSLKLMSLFVRMAGYDGLLVSLDELVNLYKLHSAKSRTSNYEQILRMLNDCLQGSASHLGFILGGTPDFLFDAKKGLYSYEALRSRLAGNDFARKAGVVDYDSPVIELKNLSPEELFILLKNLRHVYASGDPSQYLVTDEALHGFLQHCHKSIGSAYFQTPRNTIKAFLDLLSVLDQHRDLNWESLISSTKIAPDAPSDFANTSDEDEDESVDGEQDKTALSSFTL